MKRFLGLFVFIFMSISTHSFAESVAEFNGISLEMVVIKDYYLLSNQFTYALYPANNDYNSASRNYVKTCVPFERDQIFVLKDKQFKKSKYKSITEKYFHVIGEVNLGGIEYYCVYQHFVQKSEAIAKLIKKQELSAAGSSHYEIDNTPLQSYGRLKFGMMFTGSYQDISENGKFGRKTFDQNQVVLGFLSLDADHLTMYYTANESTAYDQHPLKVQTFKIYKSGNEEEMVELQGAGVFHRNFGFSDLKFYYEWSVTPAKSENYRFQRGEFVCYKSEGVLSKGFVSGLTSHGYFVSERLDLLYFDQEGAKHVALNQILKSHECEN